MIKRDNRQNRRKFGRRPAYIIVEYTVQEGTFRDILKSVAANGLFVNTTRSINAGQTIALRLPLFSFDETIELFGHVVRSGPHGFAVELDQPIEKFAGAKGRLPDIVHEIDRS